MQPPLEVTSKVVMIVDSVSPTPFALLRRAKHFEYREDDEALQQFSDYQDPVQALTEECRRVLKSISSTNQSTVSTSKASTSRPDASWSRFEDIGFGGFGDYSDEDDIDGSAFSKKRRPQGIRSVPQTKSDMGRPVTPSWADFLSSGFADETSSLGPQPLALPSDKILPPIDTKRGHSSSSNHRQDNEDLEPGELASINAIHIEDAFWWVWISSLAGEEPVARKAVFGRCALIETNIKGGTWLVIEEMVKGAASEPEVGAYIAEKKSRFGFSKKSRINQTKTVNRKPIPPKPDPYPRSTQESPMSKSSIGPDQHARIQAAAAALKQKDEEAELSPRRARQQDAMSTKTNSVFTLQPVIMSEAAPAMKWANSYDKNSIRAAYLGNNFAGKGSTVDLDSKNIATPNGTLTPVPRKEVPTSDSYNLPKPDTQPETEGHASKVERHLPALPPETPKEQNHLANGQKIPAEAPPLPENKAPPLPVSTLTHPSEQAVNEASEVPLPRDGPRPVEKDSPLRNDLTTTPTHDSDTFETPGSSPEGKKGKKLQKNNRKGIKGFFGKKALPPAPQQPVDSAAVAAARAAYPGPQMKANYTTSQTSLGRRLSGIGRKKAPPSPLPSPAPAPIKDEPEPTSLQYDLPQDYGGPRATQNHGGQTPQHYGSQASLSGVDTNEQRQADQEFDKFDQTEHRFNQGPVTDEPAFVPEDSPERAATPVEHNEPSYDVSSESEAEQPPSLAKDRWAQIRKNAAERAARQSDDQSRKPSEDYSRVSHRETDDGESDADGGAEESKSP